VSLLSDFLSELESPGIFLPESFESDFWSELSELEDLLPRSSPVLEDVILLFLSSRLGLIFLSGWLVPAELPEFCGAGLLAGGGGGRLFTGPRD